MKTFQMKDPPRIHQQLENDQDNRSGTSSLCLKGMVFVGILIVAQHLISQVMLRGYHQTIYPHHPGHCKNVLPMRTGSEDIALTSEGLAFISSGIKLFHKLVRADPRIMTFEGSIYVFDFNNPTKPAKKLKIISQMIDFAPQGIAVWEDRKKGNITLFVVNHRFHEGKDTVEIFSFESKTLSLHHERTVRNALFRSLNDITATGPSAFYVTNDGYYRFSPVRLLERFGMFPWGNVLHVDKNTSLKILDRLYEVSGIALSPDGKHVFITSPYGQAVHVYSRYKSEVLRLSHRIDLGTAPDDVTVDPVSGDLIVSCFPVWHKVFKSVSDFKERGVAQVLRITPKGEKSLQPYRPVRITELFADDGELISQSSSAVVYGGAVLIGSITDRMVYCDLKDS